MRISEKGIMKERVMKMKKAIVVLMCIILYLTVGYAVAEEEIMEMMNYVND